mmetsp:Transcript_39133/g.99142  ORF Transcript_39133/g.99142 Transcript_39133/m.99142 type:complete len:341 (-) Transcript_39133:914-1936(-)
MGRQVGLDVRHADAAVAVVVQARKHAAQGVLPRLRRLLRDDLPVDQAADQLVAVHVAVVGHVHVGCQLRELRGRQIEAVGGGDLIHDILHGYPEGGIAARSGAKVIQRGVGGGGARQQLPVPRAHELLCHEAQRHLAKRARHAKALQRLHKAAALGHTAVPRLRRRTRRRAARLQEGVVQRLSCCGPLVWVLGEQSLEELLRRDRHALCGQAREVDVLAPNRLERLLRGWVCAVRHTGVAPREEHEGHDARRVHIRLRPVLLMKHLWSQEVGGAGDGLERGIPGTVLDREAKVRGLHPPGRRAVRVEEVGRLHIAVHNTLGLALRQESQHRAHDLRQLRL